MTSPVTYGNVGHGHVHPRPDGAKERCGGPGVCAECAKEKALDDAVANNPTPHRPMPLIKPVRAAFDPVPGLDPGIRVAVDTLMAYGVETFESCEGSAGHSYKEPTIRFHGQPEEGFRAYAAAMERGLPVDALRRVWVVVDGELTGPYWEMTFRD